VADGIQFRGRDARLYMRRDQAQDVSGQLAGHPHLFDFVFGLENYAHVLL
jgi:hypothetical protein